MDINDQAILDTEDVEDGVSSVFYVVIDIKRSLLNPAFGGFVLSLSEEFVDVEHPNVASFNNMNVLVKITKPRPDVLDLCIKRQRNLILKYF